MSLLPHAPTASGRLVSEACDPTDFARAAAGWARGRVVAEVERELEAARSIWESALARRTPPPRGCRNYINFLARLDDWLRAGVTPRYARRDTREPLVAVAEALVRRGEADPAELEKLRGKPRPRR